ncbi:MAG: hypothetical protein A2W09_07605 [Deltaproteobacteria bacterium RBG_16_50_11]|nr:MAG: hypothetical protein A2W09_07605 [Deltaproteobacteria bacterium RBG_16_50_11]
MIDCIYQLRPSIISKENWINPHTEIRFEDPVGQGFFDLLWEKDSVRKRLMKSHLRGAENPQPPVR